MTGWWGRFIGLFLGYLLTWRNPLGAVIGFMIGNLFDRGLHLNLAPRSEQAQADLQQKIQTEFFRTTFLVMGHVAKADGIVSPDEIRAARMAMQRMQLSASQAQEATTLFKQGKQPQFDLEAALDNLLQYAREQRNLLRMFIDIQIQAANAGGIAPAAKQKILAQICEQLGFAPLYQNYQAYDQYDQAEAEPRQQQRKTYQAPKKPSVIEQAYALLEIPSSAAKQDIKRAYRKLMSQHHPDKLIAQGLPEAMIRLATDKTQQIQAAYERIKKYRGF